MRRLAAGIRSNLRQWCIGFAASVLVADLVGHMYYRFRHGAFLWNDENAVEVFRIWPFLTGVDDERVVVPKKSFRLAYIEFDQNGFRVGLNNYAGRTRNVVFIGDSVPFGWRASGDASVPSHFARLLERDGKSAIGTINAAVPSYSLYQAIKRYEYEIDGKFPVSAVVLQTWDPAEQLAKQGRAWTRKMNWTTQDAELNWLERKFLAHPQWVNYSSFLFYGFQAHLTMSTTGLSPDDTNTKSYFIRENVRTLEELGTRLDAHGISLYLLPANPRSGISDGPDPRTTALRWVNDSLREYARSAPRAHFIDIVQRFDEVGREGLFVDKCCHLTGAGAGVEAATIYEEMKRHGLL